MRFLPLPPGAVLAYSTRSIWGKSASFSVRPGELLQLVQHLVVVGEPIHQARLLGLLGREDALLVGQALEVLGGLAPVLGHAGLPLGPQIAQQLRELGAVLLAHALQHEGLHRALVLADAGDLELDAVFLEGARQEHHLGGGPGELHLAEGIAIERPGARTEEVLPLGPALVVGDDGLAAFLLETPERGLELREGSVARTVALGPEVPREEQSRNVGILRRLIQSLDEYRQRRAVLDPPLQRTLEGFPGPGLLRGVRNVGIQIEHQDGPLGHGRSHRPQGREHSDQEEGSCSEEQRQGDEGGEEGFEEVFHRGGSRLRPPSSHGAPRRPSRARRTGFRLAAREPARSPGGPRWSPASSPG